MEPENKKNKEKRIFSKSAKNIARLVSFVAFAAMGYALFQLFVKIAKPEISNDIKIAAEFATMAVFGIVGAIFAVILMRGLFNIAKFIEKKLSKFTPNQIMLGAGGVVCGLVLVLLINLIFPKGINEALNILLIIVFVFFGARIGAKVVGASVDTTAANTVVSVNRGQPKVLDSSVIIDGRLADLLKINFIDGPIIIPQFVEDEITNLSENTDATKAARGKRGLEIIRTLREQTFVEVSISYTNLDEHKDANEKLIKLCQLTKGKLVTVNSTLSRAARKADIAVLNMNDLSNAIKPVVLPGEKLMVNITKEGKDRNQGVGFTESGTMIVVEDGSSAIGKTVEITITTSLQTSTGRIIFGKLN